MLIEKLLNEAKFAKQEYAYHATDSSNLRSILKHGLIPNHRNDGYGSSEYSEFNYSLAPLSGIYFTSRASDVIHIAKSIELDDESSSPMIIICKVQVKSGEMDEDRISGDIVKELALIKKLNKWIEFGRDGELITSEKEIHDICTKCTNEVISRLNLEHEKFKRNIFQYVFNYIQSLINLFIDQQVDYNFDDSEVKKNQALLAKQLRKFVKDSDTFKIDQKISFSGANRIVGIFVMNDGDKGVSWGDIGNLYGRSYHNYPRPTDLLIKNNA